MVEGNAVAGSERAGFRIDGQLCGTDAPWSGNTVHSGKMIGWMEGLMDWWVDGWMD